MPENYGLTTPDESGSNQQLIVRNSDVRSRPVLLAEGVDYPRGCMVYGATPAAIFVKVATGAMPAATDIIGVVPEHIDLTDVDDNDGVEHLIYFTGELSKDTVFLNSSNDLTAANVLAIEELCIRQGLHLVKEHYGTFVPAA